LRVEIDAWWCMSGEGARQLKVVRSREGVHT